MKRILLLINQPAPPYSDFSAMFSGLLADSGQFDLEVTDDRDRLRRLPRDDRHALGRVGLGQPPQDLHSALHRADVFLGVRGLHVIFLLSE